jgi:hypothetical protein
LSNADSFALTPCVNIIELRWGWGEEEGRKEGDKSKEEREERKKEMKFRNGDASLNTQQTEAPGSNWSLGMGCTVPALQAGTAPCLFCYRAASVGFGFPSRGKHQLPRLLASIMVCTAQKKKNYARNRPWTPIGL